ncbi:MAG: arginine--tRNA ligase [Burkholderiales bacterium 35-55-47]|jgi:arginyl-tRNA synthetase|uniref:arginine--tRNA ligase n=1 Tax=Limnohabitans sp. TaxID=1907725 RepID=UPI000BDA0FC4|nr:arginine--tRNA ligase [Limnohabitans sp.]OYY18500.1 MAG: arginine--tRNA ligase [Burkholderiales bacterium 35-55-47]OYZ72911.1 MAG: arginine--tRNA ligase [Burkholderiales bacterium 24-55-52]OZA99418.1 MAG: arginine--tRNA ligase [Burkholderiales bacterium 39-55-53]HQR87333.1 arginine--tRNA ligase [Limnohabitans sp.]HQS27619.1 arginine--tRNA ligase [Limnohabitans sp.]
MLQVKQELLAALSQALDGLLPGSGNKAAFESPKVAAHGDYAITAAMQLAKPLKLNPRQLGEQLRDALLAAPVYQQWVQDIEIAGPGFINIRLKPAAKQQIVREVLAAKERFGFQADNGQRVLVEFVSANPTGPLHVGHGRQAALGDAICNLFATQGFNVYREFYYNDAGVQINTLAKSTHFRAQGIKPGDASWPVDPENPESKAFYNGDYIQDIATDFLAGKTVKSDDREFTASGDVNDVDGMREFAVAYLRHEQDLDLKAFDVKFDNYYLESSLYTSGKVADAVSRLQAAGKTYEQDGALWLKSTDYGDDKDRVMKKTDGTYTYFVPDVAYHITKWERGFTKVVNIQGTDHHGTIARVRAGLQAANVGIPEGYPDYVLHTMVRVMRGGEEVKISKRAGSYVTLRDLIEWTSKDAVRFFLLSRKPDTEYTFDVDLAVQKNNDNPVYYVQYAHARICSVLRAWADKDGGDVASLQDVDLSALESPQAQALMLQLAKYPAMLTAASADFAPHDVTFYLRDLAASYHSYYDAERILVDDEAVKKARLALVAATAQVLHNGLAVLGVSAPASM